MPLELKETRLPGVGVKWSLVTVSGSRVTVIQHTDGDREVYVHRRDRDDEPAVVLELHDDEARQLGVLLGGAYERPRIVEELEMALGEFQIEWIKVPARSWVHGRTLADCAFRKRTGVTVIATDYALRLKRELGADGLWIAGYTNEVMAYIPSTRMFGEGGYEVVDSMIYYDQPCSWAPELEDIIIGKTREMAARVGRKAK